MAIGKRLVGLLEPRFSASAAIGIPRGGIPIDVFWQTGEAPKHVWLPDQGVAPPRPRLRPSVEPAVAYPDGNYSRGGSRSRRAW